MKILAIESAGNVASCALIHDGKIVAEYTTDFKQTHSETLMPMVDQMCKMVGLDLKTLDAIAISGGPGSFTGLRIGSATAKGLGQALRIPLISVPTLDAIAYQGFCFDGLIVPMLDARRNQVFAGFYQYLDNEFQVVRASFAEDVDVIIEELKSMKTRILFMGDGAVLHQEKLKQAFGKLAEFAPDYMSKQRGAAVAALGEAMALRNEMMDAKDHKPEYLRKSQAEREREERMQNTPTGEAARS